MRVEREFDAQPHAFTASPLASERACIALVPSQGSRASSKAASMTAAMTMTAAMNDQEKRGGGGAGGGGDGEREN